MQDDSIEVDEQLLIPVPSPESNEVHDKAVAVNESDAKAAKYLEEMEDELM